MENEEGILAVSEDSKHYRRVDLEDRLIEFGVVATDIAELLPPTRTGNHLAGQMVRCSTSPMLNYGEAQAAESRQDFIHKMKVVLKELRETRVCLKFILRKRLVSSVNKVGEVLGESNQLIAIFIKSITTAQENLKTGK